ncbi:MAG TPA: YggT family protein [Chitinispirillaceae bacterium]|nr:YggT family protein [Chitinispirillaceae bacterium]
MGLVFFAFRIYELLILIRVVISWIDVDHYHPLVIWLYRLTEPVLDPIRRLIPFERIGIDLSPLVVLLLLGVVKRLIMQSLYLF